MAARNRCRGRRVLRASARGEGGKGRPGSAVWVSRGSGAAQRRLVWSPPSHALTSSCFLREVEGEEGRGGKRERKMGLLRLEISCLVFPRVWEKKINPRKWGWLLHSPSVESSSASWAEVPTITWYLLFLSFYYLLSVLTLLDELLLNR